MYEFGVILPITTVNRILANHVVMQMAVHGIHHTGYYETDIEDENGHSVEKIMCVLFDNVAHFAGDWMQGYEYLCDDANGKPMYTIS